MQGLRFESQTNKKNNKWIVDKLSKPKLLLYNVMQRDLPVLGINFLLNSICKKGETIYLSIFQPMKEIPDID